MRALLKTNINLAKRCSTTVRYIDDLLTLNNKTFVREIMPKLNRQGFWYHKLCLTSKKFAKRHCDVFSKFKMSVKRHIGDGICLPVSVLPTLTINVSSRQPRTIG